MSGSAKILAQDASIDAGVNGMFYAIFPIPSRILAQQNMA